MAALPSRWKQNETPESWVTRSDPKFLVRTDVVDQGNLPQTLVDHAGPSSPCMPASTVLPASPRVGWMPPQSLFLLSLGLSSALLCTNSHPGCVNIRMCLLKITDIDRALAHLLTHSCLLSQVSPYQSWRRNRGKTDGSVS